eukprot:10131153-Heterocapsa_arctica.AAC.1
MRQPRLPGPTPASQILTIWPACDFCFSVLAKPESATACITDGGHQLIEDQHTVRLVVLQLLHRL